LERTDRARASIYNLLAELLMPPTAENWEELTSPGTAEWLQSELAELGCNLPLPAMVGGEQLDLAAAGDAYYHSLAHPLGQSALPIESIYKPWTTDPSCELSIASEKGYLGGDASAHLADIYKALDLAIPPEYSHAPDHLGLELSLMALLVENGSREQQSLFLSQHLDWLPDLLEAADARGIHSLYRDLLVFARDFIAWDRVNLAE